MGALSHRKASGYLCADDETVGGETLSCCHCGYTWTILPGSGRQRGFCTKCMGVTCGRDCCERGGCDPVEKKLDRIEAGGEYFIISA